MTSMSSKARTTSLSKMPNEGIDTVFSLAADYTIAANVEVGGNPVQRRRNVAGQRPGQRALGRRRQRHADRRRRQRHAGRRRRPGYPHRRRRQRYICLPVRPDPGDTWSPTFQAACRGWRRAGVSQVMDRPKPAPNSPRSTIRTGRSSSADGLTHEQITFTNHAAITASDWHFV